MSSFFCDFNQILDIQGLRCPESMMMIRKKIRQIRINEKLFIITNDPSVIVDIPAFCRFMQHDLILQETQKLPYCYVILKKN
ncbi:sulfurtransferase TusA [Arsenophonus symbiont of Ornithomya chloropus]|uniref:sulfurtransferase TusA n=1 Tax=Arsenophonus symbiont of Ornithomya chloropus TaxID=634121 RepID=UPI0032B1476B